MWKSSYTLISSFAIVLSFILISTENWLLSHKGFLRCTSSLIGSYGTVNLSHVVIKYYHHFQSNFQHITNNLK